MRIIAGRFRGRRLVSFKADHIRPTTDRIKESIFNKLQSELEGARVLDLFSGTGNLTCEAVSRGAAHVDAVELSKKSIAIIRENLNLLGIEDEVRIICDDVIRFLTRYEGVPYDLIFADPPFTEKLADQLMEAVKGSAVFGDQTLLMLESSSHEILKDKYEGMDKVDDRDYGDKKITYWRKAHSSLPILE
jgi:16S rRNA (guanine966-N2)-methyltransferase